MVNVSLSVANGDDSPTAAPMLPNWSERHTALMQRVNREQPDAPQLKPPQQPQGPGYIRRRANLRSKSR